MLKVTVFHKTLNFLTNLKNKLKPSALFDNWDQIVKYTIDFETVHDWIR